MAADAGVISVDKDIISLSEVGRDVDSALRLRAVNSWKFFDLKIKEISKTKRILEFLYTLFLLRKFATKKD